MSTRKEFLKDKHFLEKTTFFNKGGAEKDPFVQYYRNRQKPAFFFPPSHQEKIIPILEKIDPKGRVSSIEAANRLMNNQFSFLGIEADLSPIPQWNRDPVTLKEYPQLFYTKVPIFSGDIGYGDVKHIWELNRHQFLIDLGQAYWFTGEEAYVEKIMEWISNWNDTNPYLMGVNWASSLEVSVRSMSWICTFYFILYSPRITERFLFQWLKSLYLHGHYLNRHLSFYFSPYNHLIGEATGLFMIAVMFPEFDEAKEWKKLAISVLVGEAEKQFHPDGGTVEQATFYHHFTLGCYLQFFQLANLNGVFIPDNVKERIEKALEFSMWMVKPDGTLPKIGDIDDAKALRVAQEPLWEFRSLLAIGATLFQRGDLKLISGKFWPNSLWILGPEGYESYQRISCLNPTHHSIDLPYSGYFVMRNGWETHSDYLCMDCGPLAAGLHPGAIPSVAHGHADCLSIELSVGGKDFIVDPGFYTYNGPMEWHRYFRETWAHNTVVVDGNSQAVHEGRLAWSHANGGNVEGWYSLGGLDYIKGNHHGYLRLPSPIVHKRTIVYLKPDYWVLYDVLLGEGNHTLDFYFHLAPLKCKPLLTGDILWTQEPESPNLGIIPAHPKKCEATIISDGPFPFGGWVAPSYGNRNPAPILKYQCTVNLPACFAFVLFPQKMHEKARNSFSVQMVQEWNQKGSSPTILHVQSDDFNDVLLFNEKEGEKSQGNNIETDGSFAGIRQDPSGKILNSFLIGGSYLKKSNNKIIELKQCVKAAEMDYSFK